MDDVMLLANDCLISSSEIEVKIDLNTYSNEV